MFGRGTHAVLIAAVLLLAGCTAPTSGPDEVPEQNAQDDPLAPEEVQGGQGSGGGKVKNKAPTFQAFTADQATGTNDGTFSVVLSGTVFDANTERQIDQLSIQATGPDTVTSTRSVTNQEATATTEPASFDGNGWKVWSGTQSGDGILRFAFQHTFVQFAPAGDYLWNATVTDKTGNSATSGTVTVTVEAFSLIEVASDPVLADGTTDTAAGWGGWEAEPGASSVSSTNYLKLTNTGDVADTQVVVDFNEAAFTSPNGSTIPIDGNVRFASFEDTTPASTAPNEGTFTFGSASSEGSVTVQFSGTGNVVYLAYQIVDMPDVLPIEAYSASYTVTEL